MDRKNRFRHISLPLILAAVSCLASTGCISALVATGIYMWQGGNIVPAECDALKGERVVVICRPPESHEFRNAGASRALGARVSAMLEANVPKIDMVSPQEVDNWVDEQDWDNFKDLGRSVKATRLVYIELDDFELYKGKTLYQGDANITITVYNMKDKGQRMWDRKLGQVLFPRNSAIPAADKPVQQFEQQFVEVLSRQIAEHFYKHNPNADFALDAVANE